MRKNYERIVAAFLSASMLFGVCAPIAVAQTPEEPQTTYVEVEPEQVTLQMPLGAAPVADPVTDPVGDPVTGPEEGDPVIVPEDVSDDIEIDIDTEGNVDAGIDPEDRPNATEEDPKVEWEGEKEYITDGTEGKEDPEDTEDAEDTEVGDQESAGTEEGTQTPEGTEADPDPAGTEEGSGIEPDTKIEVEVKGEETYTPSEPVTDDQDRVTEEGAETEGKEETNIEVTGPVIETEDPAETDKTETSEPEEVEGKLDDTSVSVDLSKGETSNTKDNIGLSKEDLKKLVGEPSAPTEKGWTTKEDGTSVKGEAKSSTSYDEEGTTIDSSTVTTDTWKCEDYEDTVDGKTVVGYKVTTTTTTETEDKETGKIKPDMSSKPENAQEVTSEDGMAGYTYTEEQTLEDGTKVTTTYTVYPEQGTYTKVTTTITTTTTTELRYAAQESAGEVTIKNVTVGEGANHGDLSGIGGNGNIQGPQVDESKKPDQKEVNESTGLRDYYVTSFGSVGYIGNADFLWSSSGWVNGQTDVGAWASSIYQVNTKKDGGTTETSNAALYQVRVPKKDAEGNILDGQYDEYYVYCVDRGQGLAGGGYNLENLQDSKYFDTTEWKKIENIAINGYWGVKDDATDSAGNPDNDGSLKAFKEMLKVSNPEYWTPEKLDKFNDGMALAATQAALWKYASNQGINTTEDPFTSKEKPGDQNGAWAITTTTTDLEKEMLKKAYECLLEKGDAAVSEEKKPTDLIDQEDITNVSVTINGKTEGKEDTYDTDLSFTMKVEPDKESDDLVVTVDVGGKLYTYRLAGKLQDGEREVTKGNDDTVYVLQGIEMPDGTHVSINLKGTQSLGKSAYLLTAEGGYNKSQSFVGIFEGERDVNLNIDLDFNATQPTATVTTSTDTVQTEQTTVSYNKQTGWLSSWLKKFIYPEPEQPNEPEDPTPEIPVEPEEPTPEIPVEPETPVEDTVIVPPAAPQPDVLPKTGDNAQVWMLLCVLSAAGVLALNIPEKKTKH